MDFFKNTLFIIIGKIFKKIIILHIHGAMFDSFCEKYHNSVKIIIARCDYIIGVSLFITNLVNTWNKNIIILPNIVDRPLFEKNKLNNKLQILFLGRIETVKGIFDILKLFEQEREYLKDKVELHIGGIGEDKRLETIINQSKLDDIVIFHGWLDKIEKHKLLSQSDILIQPSYYESFGITIVEGMSYRIPIIASNIGGIPELVEDKVNGILISPGNNQQMFNAIKYFIENEFVIKKMGDESYQRAESFYQENILEKLHDFYEGILYKKL
jgi:glycosyltransferase involved in cell wall biosynthesis